MPIISGNTHALEYARLHVMRLGASRLDYYQPWVKLFVNGVEQTNNGRIDNAQIIRYNGSTPSTMTLRVAGFTPVRGQDIKLYLGDTDVTHLLFSGNILSAQTTYEGSPNNVAYDLSCIDYTWRLNRKKIWKQYTNVDASDIVKDLVSNYANDFTTMNVTSPLGTINAIQFTDQDVTDALNQTLQRVGGDWYADFNKDLHAYLTTTDTTTALTDANPGFSVESLSSDVDLSQARTRIWSQGGGSTASMDTPVGANTMPVQDGTWYSANGGMIATGSQIITYTAKSNSDGHGSFTQGQPGTSPSPPTATQTANTTGNLTVGTYQYAVTFVSPAGESSASPAGIGTITAVNPPRTDGTDGGGAGPLAGVPTTGGSLVTGGYAYKVTYVTAAGETLPSSDGYSGTSYGVFIPMGSGTNKINLSRIPVSSDGRVTKRKIYRTKVNGGGTGFAAYFLLTTINDNTTTTYSDTTADTGLGAAPPSTDTASTGEMDLTSIVTGPSGTTSRKVYRTVVNGTTFMLLTTIADNTTVVYNDNVADGSLGATLAVGTIGAGIGDTVLLLSAMAGIPASGWVRVGSQLIYYSAIGLFFAPFPHLSGLGSLQGIPASGFGSITGFIPAGSPVTVVPSLSGISGIIYPILAGDQLNVITKSEDANAQSVLAAALGGDGVIEDFISDGRLSLTETQAHGDAQLAELKDPVTTLSFDTRDQTFIPGRSTTINLSAVGVTGTYKLQQCTIAGIGIGGKANFVFPLRTVTASSVRFTFENLLRQLTANTR